MKTTRKEAEVKVPEEVVGKVLQDEELFLSSLPYIVAREGNNVTLRFRRFGLFTLTKKYSVTLTSKSPTSATYTLVSEGSMFAILFSYVDNKLVVEVNYNGEREWIVSKYMDMIAERLLNNYSKELKKYEAVKPLAPGAGVQTGKYALSSELAGLGLTVKIISKSKLVKDETIKVEKGGLMGYVEKLVLDYINYPLLYISGDASNGKFKILIMNQEIKGIYANIEGKDYLGDEKALYQFEGEIAIRVYVALSPTLLRELEAMLH